MENLLSNQPIKKQYSHFLNSDWPGIKFWNVCHFHSYFIKACNLTWLLYNFKYNREITYYYQYNFRAHNYTCLCLCHRSRFANNLVCWKHIMQLKFFAQREWRRSWITHTHWVTLISIEWEKVYQPSNTFSWLNTAWKKLEFNLASRKGTLFPKPLTWGKTPKNPHKIRIITD